MSIVVDTAHLAPVTCIDAARAPQVQQCFGGGRSQTGIGLQRDPSAAVLCTATEAQSAQVKNASVTPDLAVVSVAAGHEHAAADRIRAVAGDAAREVFVLKREVAYRVSGTWMTKQDVAYPGCVFVAVADADALHKRLKHLAQHDAHLIGSNDAASLLSAEEAALVYGLGGADHVIRMSVGDIVSGNLIVRTGALVGREALVSHVDRHRRSAWLAAEAPARGLRVGLEVVSKS